MQKWDQFDHHGVYSYLNTIVEKVQALGAQVGSCGNGKLTLQWPGGEIVHVRRYHQGPYRWLIFTASKYKSLTLAKRDPSIRELQTATQD